MEFYNSGQLWKENLDLSLTRYLEITSNNASRYKLAMRLVQESWTKEQEEKLLPYARKGVTIDCC